MRKLKTTNRWMLGFESTALAFIMAAAGAMSARAADKKPNILNIWATTSVIRAEVGLTEGTAVDGVEPSPRENQQHESDGGCRVGNRRSALFGLMLL